MRRVYAYSMCEIAPAEHLRDGVAIVIDLLRASTTMTMAIHHGATEIAPAASVDEALALRRVGDILGGERGGVRINGFDLGNAPSDYTATNVGGRRLVFTTTNGTRAIRLAEAAAADTILIGCMANLDAVSAAAMACTGDIHLLCAGTEGGVSMEDCLCAGAIAEVLVGLGATAIAGRDDQALMMRKLWSAAHAAGTVEKWMRESLGGRGLLALKFDRDIEFCSRPNTTAAVPAMKRGTRVLRTYPNKI